MRAAHASCRLGVSTNCKRGRTTCCSTLDTLHHFQIPRPRWYRDLALVGCRGRSMLLECSALANILVAINSKHLPWPRTQQPFLPAVWVQHGARCEKGLPQRPGTRSPLVLSARLQAAVRAGGEIRSTFSRSLPSDSVRARCESRATDLSSPHLLAAPFFHPLWPVCRFEMGADTTRSPVCAQREVARYSRPQFWCYSQYGTKVPSGFGLPGVSSLSLSQR